MSRKINEIGHIYGSLTVIAAAPSQNGKACWIARCECGNEIVATGDGLRRGNYVSCGKCDIKRNRMRNIGRNNAIDITGQKFGLLTALHPIGTAEYGGVLWECECECGNHHIVEYSNLVNERVKSCGCLTSYGESVIQRWLTDNQFEYKTQYTPNDWKLSSGYKPLYDFAIFENGALKCLIEYHGEQHRKYYTNKNTWNNLNNFIKTQRRDNEKEKLCADHNIPLYIIWYDEDINQSLINFLE